MDMVCLKALLEFEEKPAYISIESKKRQFDKLMDELILFRQLGYDRFKAVQQSGISKQKEPDPPKEGLKTSYSFKEGSSGLFGNDLPGKWKEFDLIVRQHKKNIFPL
jgi:hypothetical protein